MEKSLFLAASVLFFQASNWGLQLEFKGEWAQGGPYTASGLVGKGVLLCLMEGGCPNCAKRWPNLEQLKKKYEDQPFLFVAILPGFSKKEAEGYAKSNKTTWAFFSDPNRIFEKKILADGLISKAIGMDNTIQMVLANSQGRMMRGSFREPEAGIGAMLKKAAWRLDAAKIPESMKPCWRAIEFGQFQTASSSIAQGLKSTQPAVAEAAKLLYGAIKEEIARRHSEAQKELKESKKWAAFKLFDSIASDFKDLPESKEAEKEMAPLRQDPVVAREIQARTALENIVRDFLRSSVKNQQQQGKGFLQELIQRFPGTDAAGEAKGLL